MLDDRLHIHPRCERLIECLEQYDGDVRSKHKDSIDALRYALWRDIQQPHASAQTSRAVVPLMLIR
jgi:hypothetical protein